MCLARRALQPLWPQAFAGIRALRFSFREASSGEALNQLLSCGFLALPSLLKRSGRLQVISAFLFWAPNPLDSRIRGQLFALPKALQVQDPDGVAGNQCYPIHLRVHIQAIDCAASIVVPEVLSWWKAHAKGKRNRPQNRTKLENKG